ncbi:MAG TPA: undecaprenyl-diphosphate phosphatase [Phycisphaerae bacterium]|nr:undecaprenyl-diphosphate phosphatase [Phycisphaerae bacterium]
MDWVLALKAVVMGIVEGLTEFLPISSTGHLIITGDILNFLAKEQRDVFEIFIQLGAIVAVCWEYRTRLIRVVSGLPGDAQARRFTVNLVIAFIPAAVAGLALSKTIKTYLFAPVPVATAFAVGGLVIIWAERRKHTVRVAEVDAMTWKDALKVGLAQCFALIPGTSRSGATIIGGLLFGLSRRTATEFSFFLAIPTLTAAAGYDLYKHRALLDSHMTGLLAIGCVTSFIAALLAVRGLLRYIAHHDFTIFAWYRIAFGAIVLATAYWGVVSWSQ